MTLSSVSLSISKNVFNASFVAVGARLAPTIPYTFATYRNWSLTFWPLPTSRWDSLSSANAKEHLWAHLLPLRYAVLLHFFENIVSYVPFPLPHGAMPRGWHFGHVTSTMSSFLGRCICFTLTTSRLSLNPSFMVDHWRWSTSRMRPYLALFSPHLNALLPFNNHSNRTNGSPQMALAGFFTRGILICRLTRPRELIFPQLIDLTQQYLDKDFTMDQLLPLLHQLCHRFHLPRQPLHSQCRFLTFSPDAAHGTSLRDKMSAALTFVWHTCFSSFHPCFSQWHFIKISSPFIVRLDAFRGHLIHFGPYKMSREGGFSIQCLTE